MGPSRDRGERRRASEHALEEPSDVLDNRGFRSGDVAVAVVAALELPVGWEAIESLANDQFIYAGARVVSLVSEPV